MKVSTSQEVVEGDVITFGVVGGHEIVPGTLNTKADAEFQFVVRNFFFFCSIDVTV